MLESTLKNMRKAITKPDSPEVDNDT